MKLLSFLKSNYIRLIVFTVVCIAAVISVTSFNSGFERVMENVNKMNNETAVTLSVVSYPSYDGSKSKMICEVIKCKPKQLEGTRTRLTLNNPDKKPVNYGDTVKLTGILKCADPKSIPGTFDYRNYLKSLNVASQCYAEYDDVKIAKGKSGVMGFIYSIREEFCKNADKAFPEKFNGLIKAVITGDRSGISEELSENLKVAGVYHIVAISGLHLNIFVCYIAFILSKLRIKKYKKLILTCGVCMVCGGFVLAFTGFGVSVIRAFAMLAMVFVSTLFSRDYNAKNALVVSAFSIIIFMPSNIYSTAFYLSFLSTLGVLLSVDIFRYITERSDRSEIRFSGIIQVVITSVMTVVVTLPVSIFGFGYIPVFSWMANLIVLPVMAPFLGSVLAFAVASGLGAWWLAFPISKISCSAAFVITELSHLIAKIPFASAEVYLLDTIAAVLIAGVFAACVMMFRKHKIIPCICVLMIFTLAFAGFLTYNTICAPARIHFVDVGQGDCAVIELPDGEVVLMDCGSQSESDFLDANIDSFLKHRNIKKITAAFVSHFHSDHTNGLFALLESGLIKNLFIPEFCDTSEKEAVQIRSRLLADAVKGGTRYTTSKRIHWFQLVSRASEFCRRMEICI